MKTLSLTVLSLLLFLNQAHAQYTPEPSKTLSIYDNVPSTELTHALLGFGLSALAGAGKEYYDSLHPKTHTADVKDFLATAAGGALGTFILSFDLQKALYGN